MYNNDNKNYFNNFKPYNNNGQRNYGTPYRQGSPGYQQKTGKKHTGAKFKQDRNGNPCIVAWNASKKRGGLLTLIASPISDAGLKKIADVKGIPASDFQFEGKTASGNTFQRWFYKIVNKTTGEVLQGRAFFHPAVKKLYIPRLNMVASCGRDYFGTSARPKNGR